MKLNNIKKINKGNLLYKFDLEFEGWGLTIRECLLLNGSNGQWISYPSKQYEKDGEKKYYNLVVFTSEMSEKILPAVTAQLKKWEDQQQNTQFQEGEMPF